MSSGTSSSSHTSNKLDYLQKYLPSSSSSSTVPGPSSRYPTVLISSSFSSSPFSEDKNDDDDKLYSNYYQPPTLPSSNIPHNVSLPDTSSTHPSSTTVVIPPSSPPRRRRRYDSDEGNEEEEVGKISSVTNVVVPQRLSNAIGNTINNQANDNDIDVPRRRMRHDSDDNATNENVPRRPSLSSSYAVVSSSTSSSRGDPSSSSSSSHLTSISVPPTGVGTTNSSTRISQELRNTMESAGINIDKVAQTVYRDKEGKKIDILNKLIHQQQQFKQQQQEKTIQQYEWSTGTAQKQAIQQQKEALATMEHVPFARTKDDLTINEILKSRSRGEDPMKYSLQPQNNDDNTSETKPRYTGPDPPPNRYNIRPGYRWDGVDRGNGWELKVLSARTSKKVQEQKRHLWSVSDM